MEKGKDGEEIPNRTALIEKDCTVTVDVASFASGGVRTFRKPTRTGNIREHRDFPSRLLGRPRTILVWLPPSYEAPGRAAERYPVLYLHDGQNVFDAATSASGVEWGADETAARLIGEGKIRPLILVAIANTPARMAEYAPWPDPRLQPGVEAQGDLYGRFLVEELKPFIDRTYRTQPGREHTAVGGSSLGGLISLHLTQARRETFGLCAALSVSFMWADRRILEAYRKDPASLAGARIWADMGFLEGGSRRKEAGDPPPFIRDLRALGAALAAAGLKEGKDFRCEEIEGGVHNEDAWAKRFDRVLLFLFGK